MGDEMIFEWCLVFLLGFVSAILLAPVIARWLGVR